MNDLPERYRELPILILIENYALDVVGALPPEKEASLIKITTRVWDGGADWRATIRQQLAWTKAEIDTEILANWVSFKEAARREGIPADPNVFARAFGDEIQKHH